jgi:hypothetical protein
MREGGKESVMLTVRSGDSRIDRGQMATAQLAKSCLTSRDHA